MVREEIIRLGHITGGGVRTCRQDILLPFSTHPTHYYVNPRYNDQYKMIDEAKRGAAFFRIVISPDPQKEDFSKDLYLWQITEQTMLTLEDRLQIHLPFIAADHADHTGNRHVHLLVCAKARIDKSDLQALRQRATDALFWFNQRRLVGILVIAQ